MAHMNRFVLMAHMYTCRQRPATKEVFSVQRRFVASAKDIDPSQPVQSAQADMGPNFSLPLNFLLFKGSFYPMIQSAVRQNRYYDPYII